MSILQDIKRGVSTLSALEKILALNVVIFIIYRLVTLPGASVSVITFFNWFELPSDLSNFILQPWSIVSYAFLHYDFLHMLFNMLWLFVLARFFSNVFHYKISLTVYFLGAVAGGILFLLAYNLLPNLLGQSNLIGASAAIRAMLIFLCAYMPNMDIKVFTFRLKLWHLGAFVLVLDVMGLFSDNVGGYISHLGGAAFGYFYALQLRKGNSLRTTMVNLESLFKFKKKSHLKVVHKGSKKVAGYTKEEFSEFNTQKRIDLILDKIGKSGYESLTQEEKEFLNKAGK